MRTTTQLSANLCVLCVSRLSGKFRALKKFQISVVPSSVHCFPTGPRNRRDAESAEAQRVELPQDSTTKSAAEYS